MRLINADKLEIDICYARSLNKAESIYDYSYSEKQIQNAPTAKAIPIDWIEEKIKESLYDRHVQCEDISAQVDTDTMMKSWAILIERWEKENETD